MCIKGFLRCFDTCVSVLYYSIAGTKIIIVMKHVLCLCGLSIKDSSNVDMSSVFYAGLWEMGDDGYMSFLLRNGLQDAHD
jgi:hypothetical protein